MTAPSSQIPLNVSGPTVTVHSAALPASVITLSDTDKREISGAYAEWRRAQQGDSNDEELEAAGELIDVLLNAVGAECSEEEIPECSECRAPATRFWPALTPPVQMCGSCTHNALRSGWEPGR